MDIVYAILGTWLICMLVFAIIVYVLVTRK